MDLFEILINNGSHISSYYVIEKTCVYNQITILDKLLELGIDVKSENFYKRTPMFECQSVDVLHRLYIHGADLNKRAKCGHSPLSYFILMKRSNDLISTLLSYGVKIDCPTTIGTTHLITIFFVSNFCFREVLIKILLWRNFCKCHCY